MENNYFFMVYLEGERTPTYKHDTIKQAEKEAERLSVQFNKKAYVLCTLKSFKPVIICDAVDCIPYNIDVK